MIIDFIKNSSKLVMATRSEGQISPWYMTFRSRIGRRRGWTHCNLLDERLRLEICQTGKVLGHVVNRLLGLLADLLGYSFLRANIRHGTKGKILLIALTVL